MKALVLHELKTPVRLEDRPERHPAEGQVVVRLQAAALNRRDFWITQGLYPGVRLPVVLGSDGAGTVSRIGDGVPHHWSGQEVVINPGYDWGTSPAAQGPDFRILGMPDDGTFAEEVVVPVSQLYPKPDHLSWAEAAALPLGSLTAYRALFTQGRLQPGESVLICGAGGGVATCALQLARHVAGRVLVTSSSAEKLRRAGQLGAEAGYDYTQNDWVERLLDEHGAVDLIVDGAAGKGYSRLLNAVAPGGRIVNYGATAGPPERLDMFKVFWKQVHLIGSTMGSADDFQRMLGFVQQHQIRPVIDRVLPLAQGQEALERMSHSEQFGKQVLSMEGGSTPL